MFDPRATIIRDSDVLAAFQEVQTIPSSSREVPEDFHKTKMIFYRGSYFFSIFCGGLLDIIRLNVNFLCFSQPVNFRAPPSSNPHRTAVPTLFNFI